MSVYRFDKLKGVVRICAWHQNASQLEAKAAQEHPGCPVTHGICRECAQRVRQEAAQPRAAWLAPIPNPHALALVEWVEDARQEIAMLQDAIKHATNKTVHA